MTIAEDIAEIREALQSLRNHGYKATTDGALAALDRIVVAIELPPAVNDEGART